MHQRRRIVLLFGAGIVLPSLLLGYLAFRGIQNDRALLEKERLEELRRNADRVSRAVDDEVSAAEAALARMAADHSGTLSPGSAAVPEKPASLGPIVEQVFQLQENNDIRFPGSRLLYVPDGRRDVGPSPAAGSPEAAEVERARRLEFQQKDHSKALAAYRRALNDASEPRLEGAILNAIARVQRRSGLIKEAISTYERIVRDHGTTVMTGGMPLGPTAALEIANLTRDLGDSGRAVKALLGLYRALLGPEWDLEKAEFEFFAERARGIVEELLAAQPPGLDLPALRTEFQALKDEEAASKKRTERMLVFQENAVSALKTALVGGPGAADPAFARLSLDIGGSPYLVSIQRPAAAPAGTAQAISWGIIVDADRLREDALRPALEDHFPPDEISWTVKSRDGSLLMSSEDRAAGPVTFRANFASNFPDWTVEFQQQPPRLIKTFLLSRRGFYSLVFLLLAGILVFGLVLTIRSVSHELELARMKSDFVSTVSHEFKSPLTSIRQLAEMLQSGRVPSEERRRKYYDVLLEQSERLSMLTDNILSLARLEEGRAELSFEPADIAALVTEVVSSIQERVRHEGFEIGLSVGQVLPPLAVDRAALSQAVTNLVDNAVKYSGDSRRISVGVSLEGQAVTIAVRDFGVGIRKEDIDRVFERFYRAGDALTRTVKGSGLGLTLVKEIVAAHRGSVHVESEPGKGSVFSIRLPLP